jgi:hypothetical protein
MVAARSQVQKVLRVGWLAFNAFNEPVDGGDGTGLQDLPFQRSKVPKHFTNPAAAPRPSSFITLNPLGLTPLRPYNPRT